MNDEEKINSKCPNCGSQLKYDVHSKNIICVSCDSEFDIESLGRGKLDEEEIDYETMLEEIRKNKFSKGMVSLLRCET